MWKITDFNAASVPIINKVLEDIDREKFKTVHTATLPTVNSVNMGELHVYDNGTLRRLYFKTHKGSLQYLTSATSNEAIPDIWPISRGGTNNDAFTENMFVIYNGVKLVSSPFSGDDIPDPDDWMGIFVPYVGAVHDVDIGAHDFGVSVTQKIVFDSDGT